MAINKTINKRTNSHGAMRNCIEYVLREGKTDQHLVHIIGPYPYEEVNYDLVYQSFLEEKRLWGKDSGRMYAHNVISWHKDEKITPEQALEFGIAFAEKWFSGFQTVVSVHKDKDNIHCHLVTNSVSYENGKKLHNSRKDLERMRELRENLQKISSENQKLQDELQKLTEENQKLQTELSRTQNINLSLQRSNDDLRNRNGLLSRKEQEQLEEKIRDVQDRNSKLEKMVVQSSVEAVEEALKKQQEAEKRMCSLELLMKMERRDAACQLEKTKSQMKKKTMEIEKQRDFGWLGLLICCLLFIIFVFIW